MRQSAWVSTSTDLTCRGDAFPVRCHTDDEPFVVVALGEATLFVHDLDVLGKLAAAVAEAQDLLTAALLGQDPLPVHAGATNPLTADPAAQHLPLPVDEMAARA